MKTTIVSFALMALVLTGCIKDRNSQLEKHNSNIVKAKDIIAVYDSEPNNKAPQTGLTLEILSCKPENGFWPLSDAKLRVTYKLTNISDSTLYIDPPFYSPLGGNPSFKLQMDSDLVLTASNVVIDVLPFGFLELKPRAYYQHSVEKYYADDFRAGSIYTLTAFYASSQWGAFVDEAGRMMPVWSGRIESNTVEFTY